MFSNIQEDALLKAKILVQPVDFSQAMDKLRQDLADSIGAPEIPSVTWEDIGGLQYVKDAILETLQLPLEHPELFANGMKKRSGGYSFMN